MLLSLLLSILLRTNTHAQTSIALNLGIMEHNVVVPGSWRDQFLTGYPSIEAFHYFQQPNIEVGLSYTFFGSYFETHGAWKYPYYYSYSYKISHPINLLTYCGIRSNQERLIQTYGGIKLGYWSYNMYYYVQNDNNYSFDSSGSRQFHHFAFGPRFGLSIGKKVQFTLETEHIWLTPTKIIHNYFQRVSSIQIGIKFIFKKKNG